MWTRALYSHPIAAPPQELGDVLSEGWVVVVPWLD